MGDLKPGLPFFCYIYKSNRLLTFKTYHAHETKENAFTHFIPVKTNL